MILEHKLPTILTVDEIDRLLEAVDDYIGKSSLYYILRYLFSGICDDTSYIALN